MPRCTGSWLRSWELSQNKGESSIVVAELALLMQSELCNYTSDGLILAVIDSDEKKGWPVV